jgi:hypothetical protein
MWGDITTREKFCAGSLAAPLVLIASHPRIMSPM